MIRWTTAGESHGKAIVGIIEGIPAGVSINLETITSALQRRREGIGRGARMRIEKDECQLLSGLRHGVTTGAPITVEIANTEWDKWADTLSPTKKSVAPGRARDKVLSAPRPGHADLPGMLTYRLDDARDVLERASARETAMRVALGAIAAQVLRQAAGIEILGHVVGIGDITAQSYKQQVIPSIADRALLDSSPTRTLLGYDNEAFTAAIEEAKRRGETIGGQIQVVAWNVPLGIGSYTTAFDRLDAAIAAAMMSIPSAKGVEIGWATKQMRSPGSLAHDAIHLSQGHLVRPTNNAGGIEGGISNGEPIVASVLFKPIPTVPNAGTTFDMKTGEKTEAFPQRSDTCQVVPAAVIGEAQMALELLKQATARFGGRSLEEMKEQIDQANRYVVSRLASLDAGQSK